MTHWEKAKAKGKKLPAAVILGCPPCIAYTSAQKLPETMDELTVAGGLVGAPINVVKAKTVDLLVPGRGRDRHRGLHRYRMISSPRRRSANRTAT